MIKDSELISQCAMLRELPPPPPGKSGWPWDAAPESLPRSMPDGEPWPGVTIVTPSYNQAQYLEQTIRSVLLQGYPNLEYMIVDGGSVDGSQDIIRKYAPWLTYWVSEPDAGQSEAINKGFSRATGHLMAWLNSDDMYEPGALGHVARAFHESPEAALVYGDCNRIDSDGVLVGISRGARCTVDELLLDGNKISQPAAFFRRQCIQRAGSLDPSLHYVMDYDLWLRLGLDGVLHYTPAVLASFRWHDSSKSCSQAPRFWAEILSVIDQLSLLHQDVPVALLAEARRRNSVWAAIENLFAGNKVASCEYLGRALADDQWPFGDPRQMARQMIGHQTLGDVSLNNDPEKMAECLRVVSQLSGCRQAAQLQRALVATYAMRQVFVGHRQHDLRQVRRYIWTGLLNDTSWLRNRGVWSILLQAYLPLWSRRGVDQD